ncbi:MAG: cation-transporting P-type ATPase [Candidatus Nanohaloarchaeota archaeon]|nr:cation-transporting P-type ATPase [Candidatus Nanohaloarchaeota archaeon]
MSVKEVLQYFKTNEDKGLSEKEAKKRLKIYGMNEVQYQEKTNLLRIIWNQLYSPLIGLLAVAALINLLVSKEYKDSLFILAIIVLNAVIGAYQEIKAQKTLTSLRKHLKTKVKVIRNGKIQLIYSSYLVPGDIILLEEGDKIGADVRFIQINDLEVNESILTGESKPVAKTASALHSPVKEIYELANIGFAGTYVVKGTAKAVVIATGENTVFGKISKKAQQIQKEKSPFIEEMEKLSSSLTKLILGIISIMIGIGYFTLNISLLDLLLIAVSLAVAAIPEGLPAIITISLAKGTKRMLDKKALVKNINILQVLGATDIIASDKTGTLTENKLKVSSTVCYDEEYCKLVARYCNTIKIIVKEGKITYLGDEVDIALRRWSESILPNHKEHCEILKINPFSSSTKKMSVICKINNEKIELIKGAPEVIFNEFHGNSKMKRDYEMLAKKGEKVIALAIKKGNTSKIVGLIGLADLPRPGVKEAVSKAYEAGIDIIMITGDSKITAEEVAKKIGLKGKAEEAKHIDDFEKAYDAGIKIFARVNPEHKYEILKMLKKKKYIVSMTGDGVNDILALKYADVGIAMGERGSDAAKEAADIVLLNDNFTNIVSAIEEGRNIFHNIKKSINYLISTNITEITVVFLSMLMGFVALKPLHILWINLVTDSLPAISFAFDKPHKNIMSKSFKRKLKKGVINKHNLIKMLSIGLFYGTIIALLAKYYAGISLQHAQTIALTSLVLYESLRAYMIKKHYRESLFDNKILLYSLIGVILLQIAIIEIPITREYLGLENLTRYDILLIALIGITMTVLPALFKKIYAGIKNKL